MKRRLNPLEHSSDGWVLNTPKPAVCDFSPDMRSVPSSSSAALAGLGDGRHTAYEKFFEYWRKKRPELTDEEINTRFYEFIPGGRIFCSRFLSFDQRNKVIFLVVKARMGLGMYGPDSRKG